MAARQRVLSSHPDDVQITEVPGKGETIFRVSLHTADIGLVIGKGGRTIGAIRSLINAVNKSSDRLAVEIVENT